MKKLLILLLLASCTNLSPFEAEYRARAEIYKKHGWPRETREQFRVKWLRAQIPLWKREIERRVRHDRRMLNIYKDRYRVTR